MQAAGRFPSTPPHTRSIALAIASDAERPPQGEEQTSCAAGRVFRDHLLPVSPRNAATAPAKRRLRLASVSPA
jgi:hypothetical protein